LLVLLVAAFLTTAPATAQQPQGFAWKQGDGTAAPDNPAQAAKDGFGVMMAVTPDYEAFWKAWEGPTPPQLPTTTQVTRSTPVHGMLIFSGCKVGPDGKCNVTAELSITGPDGKAYGKTMQAPVWNEPPASGYNLQLSPASIGFRLDPEDALGSYTLHASVTDRLAGTTVVVEQAITAKE
jgi:hypothetical protein